MKKPLLQVWDLEVRFRALQGTVRAVNGVSLEVARGEIVGLVGESGCGKSVTAQAIMRLVGDAPGEQVTGRILLNGDDVMGMSERALTRVRGRRMAMIFQDPMTSLNPVLTVGAQVAEGPRWHEKLTRVAARARAIEWLDRVGIPSPGARVDDYPHEFSGGMRQRVVIASALSAQPDLLIADEPTTALDVTIQAQILDLLRDLRDQTGAGLLFITHDLGVVAELCDRVAVMYAGSIVEEASVRELFRCPRHPYTRGLLQSLPRVGARARLKPISGRPPDLVEWPEGCAFADRCPHRFSACARRPALKGQGGTHRAACWLDQGEKE